MASIVSNGVDVRRRAGWLPADQGDLERWLQGHSSRVAGRGEQITLHPVITEFQQLIEGDPVLRMYAERMISQKPEGKDYSQRHLDSLDQLLRLLNELLTMAPEFSTSSMVSTPIGAVLDWTTGTAAGFAFYRDPRVNAALRNILNAWCDFLDSADSRYVLNDSENGWKSEAARQAIGIDQYQHDPADQYWGFPSWNAFFTRRFKDGQRPVAEPKNDAVIANACESTPYGIAVHVQRTDKFWIKTQPYSLTDMLAGDDAVERFVDGTVYQAFLSATNYHRWHCPVSGKIVRAYVTQGTYYSEADSEGGDALEPTNSQSYLAHVATRAVILIEADNTDIGLVALVLVGMSDVSSCRIDPHVKRGRHLTKGDELGYFQFGGSTYCLVFEPGAVTDFALAAVPQPHDPDAPLMPVNAKLATVGRR